MQRSDSCGRSGQRAVAPGWRWAGAVVLVGVAVAAIAAPAQVPPELPRHVTPATQAAIDRGLAYLAATQNPDGSWRNEGSFGSYPVAMTALAGLAFLASGSTPCEGRYAPQVERAAEYVLSSVQPSGLISRPEEEARSMYGHGFSMLFLAQLMGMERDASRLERIRNALHGAVRLTERAQSPEGGWIYTPDGRRDEGSVTITQVQGLRACRNAGVEVPKRVIDKAMAYLERSVLPDGGIAYRVGMGGPSRPPITAAAVACWFNAGLYDHPLAKRALQYCRQRLPVQGSPNAFLGHYFYAHLYMAQIMYLSGDQDWDRYYPQIRDRLIQMQQPDGSWMGDRVGRVYGTAVALIILQLPHNTLPIMQR